MRRSLRTTKSHLNMHVRDRALAVVGKILYIAASPDKLDGLSDAEFEALRQAGPDVFSILEKGRLSINDELGLPKGFSAHFKDEVLEDLRIIREDPQKRELFRAAIDEVLRDGAILNDLYTPRGTTYSDIASVIAGTFRTGEFYDVEKRPLPSAVVEVLPLMPGTRPVPVEGKEETHGDNTK